MLNQQSLAAVGRSTFSAGRLRPDWGGYCFAGIPASIPALLAGTAPALPADLFPDLTDQYDHVVLLLVDGFGWSTMAEYLDTQPSLRRFADAGVVSKLTSMFPSTTSAQLTCLHTGLPLGESGIYEWFMYDPLVDSVIMPLPFAYAGDRYPGTLTAAGFEAAQILPSAAMYETYAADGINTTLFQPSMIAGSPYSRHIMRGARIVGYPNLQAGIAQLIQHLKAATSPAYTLFYYSDIDSAGHRYGAGSPQHDEETRRFLAALEPLLRTRPGQRTLVLLTADHGHVVVDPAEAIFLNRTLPDIVPMVRRNRAGATLAPAGAPRDFFLHVEPDRIDDAQHLIQAALGQRADVFRTADLIADGLFGTVGPRFLERVGDLLILAAPGETVWWYEAGRFEQALRGHHGGLSPAEMEIPFLALPLGV